MGSQRLTEPAVRVIMVGCGGMARHHARQMLRQQDTTQIVMTCEPSARAYAEMAEMFEEAGLAPPPNIPDLARALNGHADGLDAALICTPHVYHHVQTTACLEAGIDVLLEKPMVMNVAEAESLISTRDRSGRLLVVAFNGSLSPHLRRASQLLHSGELGTLLNIHAVVWQNWRQHTAGTWRQDPVVAGGGFLFDTGAHLLNTVADLAGEDFTEVAAWLDNRGAPVDITGVVMARLRSGALCGLSACGETVRSCASDVRIFCTHGIVRTGVWGERLLIQRDGQDDLVPVRVPRSLGPWQQFLRVRSGIEANPSPPETGLRMAKLWDAIRVSAAEGGMPVHL